MTHDAPSLTPGALPAVVVPSGSKTGLSEASFSSEVSRRGALVGLELADRDDLVGEPARVDRGDRPLVRAERPRVLVLARDPELARDERRLLDHVPAVEGRDEAVVDHQVDQRRRRRAGSRSAPCASAYGAFDIDSIPPVTTTLDVAGADHRVGDLDRADRRGADLVDRVRRRLDRQPRGDRRLPRGRLPRAALEHLAHDHVLRLVRLDPGALERGADRDRAELGRRCAGASPPPSLPNGVRTAPTMTLRAMLRG